MISEQSVTKKLDQYITNDYEFTADKENIEVQIEFTFDGSTLGGADIG